MGRALRGRPAMWEGSSSSLGGSSDRYGWSTVRDVVDLGDEWDESSESRSKCPIQGVRERG